MENKNNNIKKIVICVVCAILLIGVSVAIILKHKSANETSTTTSDSSIDTVDDTAITTDTDADNDTTVDTEVSANNTTEDTATAGAGNMVKDEDTTDDTSDATSNDEPSDNKPSSTPSNNTDDKPVSDNTTTTETPVVPPSNNKPETTTEAETTTETSVSSNSTTETTSCNHKWDIKNDYIHHEAVYETKEVCVSEAWTEKVYEPRSFCYMCGMNLSERYPNGNYVSHTATCNGGSNYYTETVLVDTIYHEAVYETKEVMVTPAWDEITATYCYWVYCGFEER